MNRDELEARLALQRRWRQPKRTAPKQKNMGFSFFTVIIPSFIISIIAVWVGPYIWPKNKIETISTSSVIAVDTPTTIPFALMIEPTSATQIIMHVCAGIPTAKLNVRVTPNGDIRGYLDEAEKVKLSLDNKGEPITTRNQNWTQIDSPINGWVNTGFICK